MSKRKAPNGCVNQEIVDFLLELAEYEQNTNRNIYKYNVYRKAANVISSYRRKLQSGAEAKKLPGVGEKISQKINEYLATGTLQKLEKIRRDEKGAALNQLTRVSGIGPAKAKKLYDLGIKNLKDLHKHKDKLNHHQRVGLKRGKEECGDIDVLVTHPEFRNNKTMKISLKQIVDALVSCDLIKETLSLGATKFMGACKINKLMRRIDIRLIPHDQYFCAILYFTGSDLFNKTMRAHALEKNFTLNEYCLRPIGSTGMPGEAIPITCEEEIFEYIDYPYKKPEERNM